MDRDDQKAFRKAGGRTVFGFGNFKDYSKKKKALVIILAGMATAPFFVESTDPKPDDVKSAEEIAEDNRKSAEEVAEDNRKSARWLCERSIKQRLRHPDTAEIQGRSSERIVLDKEDGTWYAIVNVKSKNDFNMMIPSTFGCSVRLEGGNFIVQKIEQAK